MTFIGCAVSPLKPFSAPESIRLSAMSSITRAPRSPKSNTNRMRSFCMLLFGLYSESSLNTQNALRDRTPLKVQENVPFL